MAWISKTNQFGNQEMSYIELASVEQLAFTISGSDPLVALRILAEVMLNGDMQKLSALLSSPSVNNHWQNFKSDPYLNERDTVYALALIMQNG